MNFDGVSFSLDVEELSARLSLMAATSSEKGEILEPSLGPVHDGNYLTNRCVYLEQLLNGKINHLTLIAHKEHSHRLHLTEWRKIIVTSCFSESSTFNIHRILVFISKQTHSSYTPIYLKIFRNVNLGCAADINPKSPHILWELCLCSTTGSEISFTVLREDLSDLIVPSRAIFEWLMVHNFLLDFGRTL